MSERVKYWWITTRYHPDQRIIHERYDDKRDLTRFESVQSVLMNLNYHPELLSFWPHKPIHKIINEC